MTDHAKNMRLVSRILKANTMIHMATDVEKAAEEIEDLKARILLAMRCEYCGMSGFTMSALRGDTLEGVMLSENRSLLDFLDRVEKEEGHTYEW